MGRTSGPAICVEGVTAGYRVRGRKKTALRNLRLTLRPGQVTGLVGPNGAGKSTILRLLLGYVQPWAGRIRVDGIEPSLYRSRHGVGYVPESVSLPRDWSLQTFLDVGAQLSGLDPSTWPAVVRDVCRDAGLARSVSLGSLSRGQARRAILAFALIGVPLLVALDEPWTHLDADGRARTRTTIESLRARRATVMVSSHDLGEVARVSDTVHILRRGAHERTLEGRHVRTRDLEHALLEGDEP